MKIPILRPKTIWNHGPVPPRYPYLLGPLPPPQQEDHILEVDPVWFHTSELVHGTGNIPEIILFERKYPFWIFLVILNITMEHLFESISPIIGVMFNSDIYQAL